MFAEILDTVLHLNRHLFVLTEQYGIWIYLILFVVVFLETGFVVTPFLPGDSLLFAAGAIAAGGNIDILFLFLLLNLAAILGDTVNYSIGKLVGPEILHRGNRFIRKEHLDRTHQFYEKHGGKMIVYARFIPIVRTFAPFVAGIGTMNYGRFIRFNVLGALLWTSLFLSGGYWFGNIPFVQNNFSIVILVIILLSVLPIIYESIMELIRIRREGGKTR
jgi:membrane-associated protein